MLFFFSIFFDVVLASTECSKKLGNVMKIVAQINETQRFHLDDLFYLSWPAEIVIDSQLDKFRVIPPLQYLQKNSYAFTDPTNLLNIKAAVDPKTFQSLNRYALLDQRTDGFAIYLTRTLQGSNGRTPNFTHYIKQDDTLQGIQCYDLDFLDQNTLLLDCSVINEHAEIQENLFLQYTLTPDGYDWIRIPSMNIGNYKNQSTRIFQMMGNLGYRVAPSQGLYVGGRSSIEIYQFTNGEAILNATLTSVQLSQLLQDPHFIFEIVEYQISVERKIAILNGHNMIIHLNYSSADGQWNLIRLFRFQGEQYSSFQYDFENYNYMALNATCLYANSEYYKFNTSLNNPKLYKTLKTILVASNDSVSLFINGFSDQIVINSQFITFIDRFQDDFIVFENSQYTRYLAQGVAQLEFKSCELQSLTTAQITHRSSQSLCALKVEFQVVPHGATEIYQVGNEQQFLPFPADQMEGYLSGNYIFEGPMIKYDVAENKLIDLRIEQVTPSVLQTNLTQPIIHASYYCDYFKFYMVQTDDLKAHSLYIDDQYKPIEYDKAFELDVKLNRSNSVYTRYNYPNVYILETTNLISVYRPPNDYQRSAKKYYEGVQFRQIQMCNSGLLAFDPQQKLIVLLKTSNLRRYWTLTEHDVLEKGVAFWDPVRIAATYQSNLFVAISNRGFVVLKAQYSGFDVVYQNHDFSDCEEADATIYISKIAYFQRFKNAQLLITLFNTLDLTHITHIKSISYNYFQYNVPMQVASSYRQFFAHLRATSFNSKPIIVTFNLARPSHSVPFYYVEFDGIIIHTSDVDFCFVVDSQSKNHLLVFHGSVWAPYKNKQQFLNYSRSTVLGINSTNQDPNQRIQISIQVNLINRQSKIYTDASSDNPRVFELNDSTKNQSVDATSWIKGQLVNYTIICDQCSTQATPSSGVQMRAPLIEKEKLAFYMGLNIINLNANYLAILYKPKVRLLEVANLAQTQVDFAENYLCFSILALKDGFLVSCSMVSKFYIQRYICSGSKCQNQEQRLETDELFNQSLYYFEDLLIAASSSRTCVFHLPKGLESLDQARMIHDFPHSMRSFYIDHPEDETFDIFGVTNRNNFVHYSLVISSGYLQHFSFTETALYQMVERDGYYAIPSTEFLSIHPLKYFGFNTFLFTTKDLAQFIIEFSRECMEHICSITSSKVVQVLAPYGLWNLPAKPFVAIYEHYVAFQYQETYSWKSNNNIICMYNLRNASPGQNTPINFEGVVQQGTLDVTNQFVFFRQNGKVNFLATTGKNFIFTRFQIESGFSLSSWGDIRDQTATIQATNHFGLLSLPLIIRNSTAPSSHWLRWVLVGAGSLSLIAVSVLVFLIIRWKKKKAREKQYEKVSD